LIKPEKVDMANMLKEIHLKYLGVATQKNIRFTLNIQEESIVVMIDIGAFSKIINNLLMNAFKYARTEVILAAEVGVSGNGGEMLVITVWDDGIGIPESEKNNVFRKFFTVSSGKYKYGNSGGTGIGLFLAKSLTEIQGGSLRVDSVENQSTTFSVLFPLDDMRCEENIDANVLESEENEDDKLTRILVVEDNLALLDFITDSLAEIGYGVIKATNGKYAIQKLKDHHIDLVLSDVMMDEMDGLELCRYIKDDAHYCHIPVILLTAKSDPEMELDGLEVGVDAYIVKPFKLKHIELVIRNLLDVRDKLKFKFSHQPLSGASEIAQNGKDKLFVKNIVTYIEDNITSSSLSVTELGQHIGLSRSSLHKKLKTITGLGPNEFIKLIRLKAAAKLLNEGQYNISEVCYMSGFTSPSYFSKCFQLQFNMTPSEFIAESMDQKD
jgi:DNA-binding response OmpR family regulator/two-component sensor histidine kinase